MVAPPLAVHKNVSCPAPASAQHPPPLCPHLNQGLPGFLFPSVVDGGAPGTGTPIIMDSEATEQEGHRPAVVSSEGRANTVLTQM